MVHSARRVPLVMVGVALLCGGCGGGPDEAAPVVVSALFKSVPTGWDESAGRAVMAEVDDGDPAPVVESEVLLIVDPARSAADEDAIAELLLAQGAEVIAQDADITTVIVRVATQAQAQALAEGLAGMPGVLSASQHTIAEESFVPALAEEPPLADGRWWIDSVHAAPAWAVLRSAATTPSTIGVVDTGLDLASETIHFSLNPVVRVDRGNQWSDTTGHGTFVASLAAASGDDGQAAVGVDWPAKLAIADVDQRGSRSVSTGQVAHGIAECLRAGASVVNVSLAPSSSSSLQHGLFHLGLLGAVFMAHERDAVICLAAGGGQPGHRVHDDYLPVGLDRLIHSLYDNTVLVVGASDTLGQAAPISNSGDKVRLWAPGVQIASARDADLPIGTDYRALNETVAIGSGTSASTPMVAGACAAVRQLAPGLSAGAVIQTLVDTANDEGGVPVLDLFAAIRGLSPVLDLGGVTPLPQPQRFAIAGGTVSSAPFPGPVLGNLGTGTLTWSVASDVSWLRVEPASGSLDAGNVEPLALHVEPSLLTPEQSVSATLTVSSNGGAAAVVVTLTNTNQGELVIIAQ